LNLKLLDFHRILVDIALNKIYKSFILLVLFDTLLAFYANFITTLDYIKSSVFVKLI
jgi:hypothetical protein